MSAIRLDQLSSKADAGKMLPSYGPHWDEAIAQGTDVTLLERNLQLTPTQRLQQLDDMLTTFAALRP